MTMRLLFLVFAFFLSLAHAEEFLDPAVAFKPSVKALDGQTLEISYEIAKGYYLYRDKFRFRVDGETVTLGTPTFPKGKEHDDENFGKVEVYYNSVAIRVPVERMSSGPLALKLNVTSQGCADAGVCYPPQTQPLTVELPDPASAPTAAAAPADGDESGQIAATLKNAGFWTSLAFFFIAGLGLSLTPCVFPMIPILSGIIAGQGHKNSHARGFALSMAYVLGMAVTYAAAGVAAGLSGTLISAALQNSWVLGSFALVFVVLSFSMFGFYELQLPTALQSKLSEESGHLQGGRGIGVFLMGALSALIVGPCVAAPLAGALLYIGQTGDAVFGGAALFVMALGMGAPLIAVGIAGGSLLPKTGPWMEGVKKAFGVLLLATAVWLVSPVVPPVASMLAWAALLIIPAIYLHALDPLPPHAKGWHRFWKGIGIVMLLTGAALLIGALAGGRDPLQPLAGLRGPAVAAEETKLPFERIASVAELDARVNAAGRPVMLDFYADWCVSCKEMERFTFSDPAVRAKLAGFTLLQADVTANTEDDKALLARFKLFGPPGIIFYDAKGQENKAVRVVGFQDAAQFMKSLQQVTSAG
ncbi:MAG: protein-disulfide reductase DsbD [Gammaproteobacteria bacterium]|nr:protein-disulfide reductase DsbD [Gammaproteobacteria bacterium]MBU1600889.1 protein-disulfide reductase DsbD [Gammaproteobacteria bacterium]MBU2435345.1 protein-disulfide reductase DsbD [Gammaproteobacteria bacterium]MBU2448759.1 protein-disulfide reductase DsbD [Gammaproteobacteria bacterium]